MQHTVDVLDKSKNKQSDVHEAALNEMLESQNCCFDDQPWPEPELCFVQIHIFLTTSYHGCQRDWSVIILVKGKNCFVFG